MENIKNIKKILFIFVLFCGIFSQSYAQAQGKKGEKIKKARQEYIKKRLNLTPDQDKKFWVVYEAYIDEHQEINKAKKQMRLEMPSLTATDEQLNASIQEMLNLKQKEVDIEKTYITKFKAIISVRQLVEMYNASKDFNRLLLDKLRE